MSDRGRTKKTRRRARKPPPHWRKYLVQAELELPPPTAPDGDSGARGPADDPDDEDCIVELPWWQERPAVIGLAALCAVLLVATLLAMRSGMHDRAAAQAAEDRARTLTLRAISGEQSLRIAPNPRSWSAVPDATLRWPEPPQLLALYLPVSYADYVNFALVIDKVDHGRVMVVERMTPDSNRDLRISLNSSAFGPGEYRLRVQGYTWRGERVDVGWVRLVIG
ncbi:MAG TPA: hypothetical protein VF851_10400 [Steroidobacteraceae bacterium]